MATHQIVARFEQERQALALMDHPNIAKVFDGGTTPSRRPYFVMELVKGIPITEFCDQHHLTVRQRLELFISVCQAVQHAHQKGIIHRDLKPANVLVSRHDTTPVVKVIDFGVAKALGQELTENTLLTGIAQTNGTTPFTKERFKQAGYDEMRRIIGEEEPPRPSTRLSEATESRSSLSAQRQLELAKLTKLVRGELDWIVMKCLEKDRNRRYETANALALDVQRYLADEPVQACPPSLRYRFGKFARRNKAAVGIAAMIVVAALTVLAGALWHNRQLAAKIKEVEEQRTAARREAGRADANFAKTLEAVDKFLSRMGQQRLARIPGMERVRREVLEEALQFFQGFLQQKGDEPAVRWEAARAYFRVGHIQNLLGRHRAAEQSYRRATELLGQLTSAFPAEAAYHGLAASCQTNLAILLKETGRYGEAERAFQRA